MKQLNFFATGDDIRERLGAFEATSPLKYVRCDHYQNWRIPTYRSIVDIPGVGASATGSHARDPDYLVLPRWRRLRREWLIRRGGSLAFAIHQAENTRSLVIRFGGEHTARVLVAGRVATIHGTGRSDRLYDQFSRALTSGFLRNGSYWVSPGALALAREGWRLVTMDLRENTEYDLTLGECRPHDRAE